MPYIERPDCRLFYTLDDHTDAWTHPETVLFVHGFTETTEAWRAWVPHFSRRYRVIRIDQRGFGRSGAVPPDYPLTTELYVQDLAAVVRQVAGEPVHVIGGKSGGISVFPEEIEDTLKKHPDVVDAAVIGFKSAEWGEAVKAFVVLNSNPACSADALIQFCKQSLAPYKAPKVVEFLSTLPRTGLGKIDRGKLRAEQKI